jgi:hypothetical protein
LVHPLQLVWVEREPVVVEVEEPTAEALPRARDVERRDGEGDADREEGRYGDGDQSGPPGAYQRRRDCEQHECERAPSTGARVLEAQPVDRDHESGDA